MIAAIMALATGLRAGESATGWALPVPGSPLPSWAGLLPNAPRDYRGGIHQGVDFFWRSDGTPVACGDPVISVCDGEVIRADHAWPVMSSTEYDAVTASLKDAPHDEAKLDRLRARQVRVRCADGLEVRYGHLESVAPGLVPGCLIDRRDAVGTVGNSGTQDGSKGGTATCHLHFEAWTGPTRFLGQAEPAPAARKRYADLFRVP